MENDSIPTGRDVERVLETTARLVETSEAKHRELMKQLDQTMERIHESCRRLAEPVPFIYPSTKRRGEHP